MHAVMARSTTIMVAARVVVLDSGHKSLEVRFEKERPESFPHVMLERCATCNIYILYVRGYATCDVYTCYVLQICHH
jgi:hypothetical protein